METNPIDGCNINVMGSLNVVEARVINDVPITIGVSTDQLFIRECIWLKVFDGKSFYEQ